MPNPIIHFEIIGRDRKLLESFYGGVFDWQFTPVMEHYSMVLPGEGIHGGIGEMPQSPCNVTVYVEVADVSATLTAAATQGGHTAYGPETLPNGQTVAGLVDPEGHLIGLMQARETR